MARPNLKNFRRIVVKVGSSLLIDSDAGEVRATWLAALAADLARLHGEGRELLIVSSGSTASILFSATISILSARSPS